MSNTSAWIESGPVTIQAVRKNYRFGDQLVATRRGDEVYFIHADHLGSTSLTTDISGTVVAQTRYLPYGEERWTDDGAQPTDFTFTGQRTERGFGLMDYQARYFDPRLGRFASADMIVPEYENPQSGDFENPQSLNRYSYTFGNPLKYNDPTGNRVDCGWDCHSQSAGRPDPPPPHLSLRNRKRDHRQTMDCGVHGNGMKPMQLAFV